MMNIKRDKKLGFLVKSVVDSKELSHKNVFHPRVKNRFLVCRGSRIGKRKGQRQSQRTFKAEGHRGLKAASYLEIPILCVLRQKLGGNKI